MAKRPTKRNRYEEEIEDMEEEDLDQLENDDDEDEVPPPKKRRSKAKSEPEDDDDEDEAPPPKKRRSKAKSEPEDDDDEDEAPPPKKRRSKAKSEPEDDDDEDEAPPPKKRSKPMKKKSTKVFKGTVLDEETGKIRTPKGLVMFPNLFTKYISNNDEDDEGKYMVSLLFDEDTDLSVLEDAVEQAMNDKFKSKWPKNWLNPIRDGEEKSDKYPIYEGKRFISASTQFKPGVIDLQKNELFDEDDVYSGCFGRMTIVPYAWQFKGKSGVSFGLRNFQKIEDGEPIQSGGNAADDFDD